jgi:replication initiation and membrane attachment protein DnaB
MKRKILLSLFTLTVIGSGLFMSKSVLAEESAIRQNPFDTLAQKIADKFGLNKDDVQAVFDEDRTEHQVEMEAEREERQDEMQSKFEEKLSQGVTDGKITEAQKELILAKHEELEVSRQDVTESFKDMTNEERKTAMEEERKALETWANENGIDIEYFMDGFGMKGFRGEGGPNGPRSDGEMSQPPFDSTTSQ